MCVYWFYLEFTQTSRARWGNCVVYFNIWPKKGTFDHQYALLNIVEAVQIAEDHDHWSYRVVLLVTFDVQRYQVNVLEEEVFFSL